MGVPASATSIASITIYDLKNRRRFVRFLIRESITLIRESTMSQLRTETSDPILRRLGDMQLPSPDRKLAIQYYLVAENTVDILWRAAASLREWVVSAGRHVALAALRSNHLGYALPPSLASRSSRTLGKSW